MAFARKTRKSMKMSNDEDEVMSYDGSYIDSSEDCEYAPNLPKKRQRTITNVSELNRVQRRPTRVPNLKIQNRNALLARENRLRKKQMMEEMESSVNELETENHKLIKMMKFKDRKNEELIKEVRYLKSVIANRTEIVSVLKALPKAFPATKNNSITPTQSLLIKSEMLSYASSDTLSISEDIDNGIKEFDPILEYVNSQFIPNLDIETEWDQILKNPFNSSTDFSDIPKLEIDSPSASPSSSGVSSDHNYSHYDENILESIDQEQISDPAPGVCIHINRGKVSLEFCVICFNNNNNNNNN